MVIAAWTPTADAPVAQPALQRAVGFGLLTTLFLVMATVIALASRNIRLGRGDRRGARRLAFACGAMLFIAAMLGSDHVAAASELTVLLMSVSWTLFVAALVWLAYIAVEPYVRRRWPQVLISWTRLLSGRWRDPLIGRELLFGSLIGVAFTFLGSVAESISRWRGTPPRGPDS